MQSVKSEGDEDYDNDSDYSDDDFETTTATLKLAQSTSSKNMTTGHVISQESDIPRKQQSSAAETAALSIIRPTNQRHQLPNVVSTLPDYSNREQDVVRDAFTAGNLQSLRSLPAVLRNNNVLQSQKLKMQSNRMRAAPPQMQDRSDGFSQLEYISSRLSLADELQTRDRLASYAHQALISNRPFHPASSAVIMKHEDFDKTNLALRLKYVEDPYELAQDSRRRASQQHKGKVMSMHKPFRSAGGRSKRGSQHPNSERVSTLKASLKDLLKAMRRTIKADWATQPCTIRASSPDASHIRIRFPRHAIQDQLTEASLAAYFNCFAAKNKICRKYRLQKCVDEWGVSQDNSQYLCFTFSPPWAHTPPTAMYNSLHPKPLSRPATTKSMSSAACLSQGRVTLTCLQPDLSLYVQ